MASSASTRRSTLTKLMQRLYSPQAGQVMIDGVDALSSIRMLRRQIGTCCGDILFNRTIHENIALGDQPYPRVVVMQTPPGDEFIAQFRKGTTR